MPPGLGAAGQDRPTPTAAPHAAFFRVISFTRSRKIPVVSFSRSATVARSRMKVEAGPKGIVMHFRDRSFANPAKLAGYIADQRSFARRPPGKGGRVEAVPTPLTPPSSA
jgi:hypothetical protein